MKRVIRQTPRLRLWRMVVTPSRSCGHQPRIVYIACLRDVDDPSIVATASVWTTHPFTPLLERIDVVAHYRRQGLACEMVRALQSLHPGLCAIAVSKAGSALIRATGLNSPSLS